MNIFEQAVQDIFAVSDFTEPLTLNADTEAEQVIDVSSYVGNTAEKYTEWGYDHGDAIAITCKCADWPSPQRGQQVLFRSKVWKVSEFEPDSHALCYKVYLKSVESK